ncbi:carbohydrate ABC transporter permease [Paenibacillus senegalimassiliensis]|uniref:carbohydrate ABC transporter permease n=1 Tax=Paenibacillus senegalimassiliensis TaxID=1737426 RepID=UPI00073F6E33|nr:carbohydrate ABC transporter permease [Paenibacillus senegalimassiliensis]
MNYRKLTLRSLTKHAVMLALSLFAVFPFYWMIISSFRTEAEMYSSALWPKHWTWDNYADVWRMIPMLDMLGNSTAMSVAQTFFQLGTAILAAYAFSRWTFPGSRVLFLMFALTWLIPFQVTMIPNYVTISAWGWRNTLQGLIAPNLVSAFAIISMTQSFKAFPKGITEAALLDGASSWSILWRMYVPNMKASIASLGILLFINSWNEYFWPLLLTNKLENTVIQIGLQMFMSSDGNAWGPLMAAAVITSVPILAVYLMLQRQIVDSFVKMGLK